ncbi:MAG: retron system putative HNH endonuclease [Methylococcales bacterium]
MRYINKNSSPDFFEQEKQQLNDNAAWDELHCKTQLRLHLIAEQQTLCAYCERGIDAGDSHIEHIDEQSNNPALRFDYQNLIASCNGDLCHPESKENFRPEDIHSCGHKKGSGTDINLFLNPVAVQDIGEYFSYHKEICSIIASEKDSNKANYTIQLLNLDNPRLNNERHHVRTALAKVVKTMPNAKQKISQLLEKERAFISFLRFYYAAFL